MRIARLEVDAPLPRLRVVGDVALRSHGHTHAAAIGALNSATGVLPTVANLEGPVVTQDRMDDRPGVWSTTEPLRRVADELRILAFSLANNHVHDLGGGLDTTLSWASAGERAVFGLDGEGIAPALVIKDRDDREWVLVGCGWPGSGCRRRVRRHGWRMLSPLDRELDALLLEVRHRWPDAALIVLPHWNYEFAVHPHPAFRMRARRWAALGVDCIVGAHPHVLGGYEAFGSTSVAYSVGNAVFDRSQYFGGSLRSRPEENRLGAVLLDHASRNAELFVAQADDNGIRLAGPQIADWTGYADALLSPYEDWYRAHRHHRRRGLPVFSERDGGIAVAVKEAVVRQRAHVIAAAHHMRTGL